MNKSLAYSVLHSQSLAPVVSAAGYLGVSLKGAAFEHGLEDTLYVCITVDVEPGYLNRDKTMSWLNTAPDAFVGAVEGMAAWQELLSAYRVPATYFVTPMCFAQERFAAVAMEALRRGSEIGLHMHPREDLLLQQATGKKYSETSCHFFTSSQIETMLSAGKKIVESKLAPLQLDSVRWGNWGLNTNAVKPLEKIGFSVDASACPGIAGHTMDERRYDWRNSNRQSPWQLSDADYQVPGSSPVLEIPTSTFSFFGNPFRADPVLGSILTPAFSSFYKRFESGEAQFFFTTLSHSSEAVYQDGSPTPMMKSMEAFLKRIASYKNVECITLKQAAALWRARQPGGSV